MTETPEHMPEHLSEEPRDQQRFQPSEPQAEQQHDVDLHDLFGQFNPAMLVAAKLHHEQETRLERYLADLVRDELIDQVPLPPEQREQIQLEVAPTIFEHLYRVHYVLPAGDLNKPKIGFCTRLDDGTWDATVYQGTNWRRKTFPNHRPKEEQS